MKKKCFVFLILLFCFFTSKIFAQNEPEKKWNVAVGYSTFDKQVLAIRDNQHLTIYYPQIFIKSGYKPSVFWELGFGFGYAHKSRIKGEEDAYNLNGSGYAGWVYSKYHLLPHFIQDGNFPLDVYLSGKAGRYFKGEDYSNWHYGAYAGASLYLFGNLGIYGEIG